MSRRVVPTLLGIAWVLGVLPQPAAVAGAAGTLTGKVYARERADGEESLLLHVVGQQDEAGGGGQFDSVTLDLAKRLARALTGGLFLEPEGCSWSAGSLTVTCPPGSEVRLRLDLERGTKIPKQIDVEVRLDDETVLSDRLPVERLPTVSPAKDVAELVDLPAAVTPGGLLVAKLDDRVRREMAGWEMAFGDQPLVPEPDAGPASEGYLAGRVPVEARPGDPVSLECHDAWGEQLGSWPGLELPILDPVFGLGQTPFLTTVSPLAFAGQRLCVCGNFPSPDAMKRLRIGDTPLGLPNAASTNVLEFTVPAGLTPGQHEVSAEFDPDAAQATEIVEVHGTIKQEEIWVGDGTDLTLRFVGTEKQLPVELVNNSDTVRLAGGNRQTLMTPGGAENFVQERVVGIKKGPFDITYTVNAGVCCVEKPQVVPPDNLSDPGTIDLDRLLADIYEGLYALPVPERPLVEDPGSGNLCLTDDRFRVCVDWPELGTGARLSAPYRNPDTGLFYFFNPDNVQFLLKALDGCRFNDHFWVFAAATTSVEYTVTVTDTQSGRSRVYDNPLGRPSPAVVDTQAFATCP